MGLNSGRFVLQTRVASQLVLFFFTLPCIIPPPPPFSPHCQLTSIPLVFIFPSLDSPCSHRPRIQFGLKGRPLCVPPPRWFLGSHVAEKKGGVPGAPPGFCRDFRSRFSHVQGTWWTHLCNRCFYLWCLLYKENSQIWAELAVTMFRELPEADSSECLGSMTPETQDIYLRLDHHRRRSGYRLGRIIARQQLLKRIAAGN